ncbi:hypothetical protein DFQ29_009963 [Apophysomyces sp. BC1021]|nr:hypothetical protein DFQ29_009963 [Apophysomyces sp. BC1021]
MFILAVRSTIELPQHKPFDRVGRGDQVRRKNGGSKSYNAIAMSIQDMKQHLLSIRQEGLTLAPTQEKDGFRFQLLVFKLRELSSVRYKQLPETVLPDRLTSTVGGVNHYLTEIRNIVKTKDNVKRLWGCEPNQIEILSLDLGQTCVVGTSALLPAVVLKENASGE